MAKPSNARSTTPASSATAAATRPQPVAAAAKSNGPVSELKPSADQIRRRAFEIYQDRVARGIRGDAHTDWLQAEREIARAR